MQPEWRLRWLARFAWALLLSMPGALTSLGTTDPVVERSARTLRIAEAELGDRIMRALILRSVGLLESGAGGPKLVGRA